MRPQPRPRRIEERGDGADGSLYGVPVPRDGGVTELLEDARRGLFDAVIVECIDRLSRKTADSTRVEQELEQLGIGLFASDEPMTTDATAILTRRVKQGVAEWYVRDLIEKSGAAWRSRSARAGTPAGEHPTATCWRSTLTPTRTRHARASASTGSSSTRSVRRSC